MSQTTMTERNAAETTEQTRRSRFPRGFKWFAAGAAAFVFALCLPLTRDVVRTQIYGLAALPGMIPEAMGFFDREEAQKATERQNQAIAARHSDDAAMQICLTAPTFAAANPDALNATPAGEMKARRERLQQLSEQFPQDPLPAAALLRQFTRGAIHLNRDDEEQQMSRLSKNDPQLKKTQKTPAPNAPDALAAFDNAAAHGEAIDPRNGFFPALRAFGLLAAHRDDEALAALHRAASLPKWDDYLSRETDAKLRLADARNGMPTPTLAQVAVYASELLPHFASLRGVARVSTALAMQKEIAGDKAGGIAIRKDMARIGARLRVDSKWLIGSYVGIAVTAIASARPDGMEKDGSLSNDARAAKNLTDYLSFLKTNHEDEEVIWYAAERQKGVEARALGKAGLDKGLWDMKRLALLGGGWVIGFVLLLNLFWTAIFGGVSAAFLRRLTANEAFFKNSWVIGSLLIFFGLGVGFLTIYLIVAAGRPLQEFGAITGMMGNNEANPSEGNNSGNGLAVALMAFVTFFYPLLAAITYATRAKRAKLPVFRGILRGFQDERSAKRGRVAALVRCRRPAYRLRRTANDRGGIGSPAARRPLSGPFDQSGMAG